LKSGEIDKCKSEARVDGTVGGFWFLYVSKFCTVAILQPCRIARNAMPIAAARLSFGLAVLGKQC
jgi:hypothetical protein